jgi:ABC-type Fe3+/spermidine/putrescine transport system ATPase subunit
MINPVAIRLDGVSKRFDHRVKGEVYAVREVSLEVRPGELLTLLGPSGCGKTTTLRMIAGFQEPDAGRIFIGGQDVTRLMANERNIGFVFQSYALFPHLSVFENVAYGLRVKRQTDGAIAAAVGEVLALVGLAGYERQLPHQLSGGEQQRVALARAIVIKPRVLLFDEPLSNLDARLRVQMRGEIQRLQKALGITAVYVTHDQEEAMAISDRIAVMHQGVIVQEGSAETLYHRPASEFVAQFIGRTNLLRGLVIGLDSQGIEVDVQGYRLRVAVAGSPPAPGASVTLVVRPEAVTISPGSTGLTGTVLSRTFLGEKAEYQVRVGTEILQVTAYGAGTSGPLAPGDAVSLGVPSTGVWVLEAPA